MTEERLHWCEVERAYDQMEEAEVSRGSSQARMAQQEGKPGTKRKMQKQIEWFLKD